MKIFQFIEKYCQDLITEARQKKQLVDLSEFPHDGVETDIEGNVGVSPTSVHGGLCVGRHQEIRKGIETIFEFGS